MRWSETLEEGGPSKSAELKIAQIILRCWFGLMVPQAVQCHNRRLNGNASESSGPCERVSPLKREEIDSPLKEKGKQTFIKKNKKKRKSKEVRTATTGIGKQDTYLGVIFLQSNLIALKQKSEAN